MAQKGQRSGPLFLLTGTKETFLIVRVMVIMNAKERTAE